MEMKLNCIIVDDEHLARTLLKNYISKLPQLNLIKSCSAPQEALEIIQSERVDLIFLDIQMPELTGFEMLNTLVHKPITIITTAYPEYALEGFKMDVLDYLVKPFPFERFVKAVNKATELYKLKSSANITSTPRDKRVEEREGFITVKADYKTFKIQFRDIYYIEGLKEYVVLHCRLGKITTLESLKRLEESLPDEQFIRIHKSYIAQINKIDALEGNMLHLEDTILPIGKSFRKVVLQKVFNQK